MAGTDYWKRCPVCNNDCWKDEDVFTLDPSKEICNSCWRSHEELGYPEKVSPPDLSIDVHEETSIETGLA